VLQNEHHNSSLSKVNWNFLNNVERGKAWPLMATTLTLLRAMANSY